MMRWRWQCEASGSYYGDHIFPFLEASHFVSWSTSKCGESRRITRARLSRLGRGGRAACSNTKYHDKNPQFCNIDRGRPAIILF